MEEKFVLVSDYTEPVNDPTTDACFISKGYDATTHFETTVDDVLELYTKITGKVMCFKPYLKMKLPCPHTLSLRESSIIDGETCRKVFF